MNNCNIVYHKKKKFNFRLIFKIILRVKFWSKTNFRNFISYFVNLQFQYNIEKYFLSLEIHKAISGNSQQNIIEYNDHGLFFSVG